MARPKLGDSGTERLHIKITSDEVKAIDDWRYENRIPSRSEAVRRLAAIALACDQHVGPLASELPRLLRMHEYYLAKLVQILDAPQDWQELATESVTALAEVSTAQLALYQISEEIIGQLAVLKGSDELVAVVQEASKARQETQKKLTRIRKSIPLQR